MTSYTLDVKELANLKDKTILVIGAVSGIGKAVLQIAHEHGARIAFGDWNEDEGHKIKDELKERIFFQKCDVSAWDDVLSLFDKTWNKFGTIHAVISNAGVNTHEGLLDDQFDKETGLLLPPDTKSVDINLIGQVYISKCALHFFKKWPETRSHLILTASAASFFPAPPIHMYCAAKSGVLGLMRALRYDVVKRNTTINIVAPWLTITPMVLPDWLEGWGKLPKNTPEGVAYALLLPVLTPDVNGKAFFVAGNEIIEFEDSLLKAQPIWMGQELSDYVNQGQKFLLGE